MATTYLTRTPGSAGSTTKGTFSFWVKRGVITSDMYLWTNFANSTNWSAIGINNVDQVYFYAESGGSAVANLKTNRVFRDPSAWYHIVVALDSTDGTADDRVKIYINGVQETSFVQRTNPSSSADLGISEAVPMEIGRYGGGSAYFDGSMANVEFVDGTALTPAYFGSTDSTTGIWTPQAASTISSYGTNGFKLKMDTATPGADTSGNTNTFTVGGGTPTLTQGNPDNNYACMNPLFAGDNSAITYSNGNLKTTATSEGQKNAVSTIGVSSGKWYCEMVSRNGNNYPGFGIMDSQSILQTSILYLGSSVDSYCMFQDGNYYTNGSAVSTGTTWGVGSIMGISIDLNSATKTIKFYKNGAEEHSATIATPANDYVFAVSHNTNGTITEINFGEGFFGTTAAGTNADGNGQGLFAYAVPSGYYALNTKNLEAYG